MSNLTKLLGSTDIYIIDQIMKGRYGPDDTILDAGCGQGRNLVWFIRQKIDIHGVDQDAATIQYLKTKYPQDAEQFILSKVDKMPFPNHSFDHIISSAVLHFAKSTEHFHAMTGEQIRVLKPGGSFFVRMTSDIGIEDQVISLGNGTYQIPDGSTRFLLTRKLLSELLSTYKLELIEPFKTTNVNDIRCMSTCVFKKSASPS